MLHWEQRRIKMAEEKGEKSEKKNDRLAPIRRDYAKEALEEIKEKRQKDAAIRDTHKPPDPKKGDK